VKTIKCLEKSGQNLGGEQKRSRAEVVPYSQEIALAAKSGDTKRRCRQP